MNFKDCIDSYPFILMEGALGERLKREFDLDISGTVAMADLVYQQKGRLALETLWNEYIDIAYRYQLPFLATTPTRRANKERIYMAGYNESIIADNVDFLRSIKEAANVDMYIGGLMGCKGDAYTGEEALNLEEAIDFHSWQAGLFKSAKVDFLYAGIMPVLTEAIGMAVAMSDTDIPYIISFTIQRDGKLIDGHTIDDAIHCIDNHVSNKPVCYMTNCVHPDIVYEALSHKFNQTQTVKSRFWGIQANTSQLSYKELEIKKNTTNVSKYVYSDETKSITTSAAWNLGENIEVLGYYYTKPQRWDTNCGYEDKKRPTRSVFQDGNAIEGQAPACNMIVYKDTNNKYYFRICRYVRGDWCKPQDW